MYKYSFHGQIREADGPEDAYATFRMVPPEPEDPDHHFLVRVMMWHEPDKDYTVEKLDGCGHRVFDSYATAMDYFWHLEMSDVIPLTADVKLELVQVYAGVPKVIQSKVLLRTVFNVKLEP